MTTTRHLEALRFSSVQQARVRPFLWTLHIFTGPTDGGMMVTSLREGQEKTGPCWLETCLHVKVSTLSNQWCPWNLSADWGGGWSVLISDQEGARDLAFLYQLTFPSSHSTEEPSPLPQCVLLCCWFERFSYISLLLVPSSFGKFVFSLCVPMCVYACEYRCVCPSWFVNSLTWLWLAHESQALPFTTSPCSDV